MTCGEDKRKGRLEWHACLFCWREALSARSDHEWHAGDLQLVFLLMLMKKRDDGDFGELKDVLLLPREGPHGQTGKLTWLPKKTAFRILTLTARAALVCCGKASDLTSYPEWHILGVGWSRTYRPLSNCHWTASECFKDIIFICFQALISYLC